MSLLKQENELEDKSIYYVQDTNRTSNGEIMQYSGLFLPSASKALLDNRKDEISAELLKVYNVPVKCSKKLGKNRFEKIDNTEIKVIYTTNKQLEEIFNFDIESILNDIESNILESFSKIEGYLESDENLQKNLYTIMDKITIILDQCPEIDMVSPGEDIRIRNYVDYEASVINNLFLDICNNLGKKISNAILLNTVGASFGSIINNIKSYLHIKLGKIEFTDQDNQGDEIITNHDTFNGSLKTLQTHILFLNTLFQEDENDKTIDPRINELEKSIWSFIGTRKKYPETEEEIMDLHEGLSELWKEFLINSFGEEYDILDAFIQYRNNIIDIENNIREILRTKSYKYIKNEIQTIHTLSARDFFERIRKYNEEGEQGINNLISCIQQLQECDDKEIRNMLSKNESRELLNILVQQETYEFASRIRDIVGD